MLQEREVGYKGLLAGADVVRMECVPKKYLIDDIIELEKRNFLGIVK